MSQEITKPPMAPSDEANRDQLELARSQGSAAQAALREMIDRVADSGGETECGDYRIAYAVEQAEGMYELADGELRWGDPGEKNLHVEIAVSDAADGRLLPGLTVFATLIGPDGQELGTEEQPFVWHPWLFHYGRNWRVPRSGEYRLRVRIDLARFPRHDRENGRRYSEPVEVEFDGVKVTTGQE